MVYNSVVAQYTLTTCKDRHFAGVEVPQVLVYALPAISDVATATAQQLAHADKDRQLMQTE